MPQGVQEGANAVVAPGLEAAGKMVSLEFAYFQFPAKLDGLPRTGPCGTTLATAFGSDLLRSVDTLGSSRAPSCDLASLGSSLGSSGNLTASP